MSNSFNIHPQYQGLQPAIPFERPARQFSTRHRLPRTETPIHPPQVPQGRSQHHQQQHQQQDQQPQQPQMHQAQQLVQQAQQLQTPRSQSYNQQSATPPQIFHRITPGQKPRSDEELRQIQLNEQLAREAEEGVSPQELQAREQQLRQLLDQENQRLDMIKKNDEYMRAHPKIPKPRKPRARFTQAQLRAQEAQRQAQQQAGSQTQQPPETPQQQTQQSYPETIQISDEDDSMGENTPEAQNNTNNPNSANNTGEGGAESESDNEPWIAPLTQPITPLRLPAIRPMLMLGPYDSRDQCYNAIVEYGNKQGWMPVMSGCARNKGADGRYSSQEEVVRVDLKCDRGGICKNMGKGIRRRATNKLGCPAKFKMLLKKRQGDKWFLEMLCEEHNHDLDPTQLDKISAYRRWRRTQSGLNPTETHEERKVRLRKTKVDPPVPSPTFHNIGHATAATVAKHNIASSPSHVAALKGQFKILEILLDNGADINALDGLGRSPLHCAVEGQSMSCVQLLVDRGADVARLDGKGVSALHMAVEKGMKDAVVLFIERGADPNR